MPAQPSPHAAHLWVAGSDAPEKPELNLGFLPLSDAASLIVAATQGFGEPHGLTLNLHRQPRTASTAWSMAPISAWAARPPRRWRCS